MAFNPHFWFLNGKSQSVIVNNTFIGGVASIINTPALLADKLSCSESNILNFAIVGSDIECYIDINYQILSSAFLSNTSITYYYDYDNNCNLIEPSAFNICSNLYDIKLEGVLEIGRAEFQSTSITKAIFPNCLTLSGNNTHFYGCINLEVAYLPLCTNYGTSVGFDNIFTGCKLGLKVYAEPTMETINAGGVDGDLLYVTNTLSGTITYVTNFTSPNQIIDLSVNTVFSTSIILDWSIPTSTNLIDYYEVYVNGILNQEATSNTVTILGLNNLQTYNFTVIAVDIFYNKSIISNVVNQQING